MTYPVVPFCGCLRLLITIPISPQLDPKSPDGEDDSFLFSRSILKRLLVNALSAPGASASSASTRSSPFFLNLRPTPAEVARKDSGCIPLGFDDVLKVASGSLLFRGGFLISGPGFF